jgi:3-hydroxyisobutyrate dehydrogenase-like beta-hydroxyacid dehydrogenase
MNARIAVLGTGRMGSAIARRLAGAGHELTVWDRTRAHAEAVGVGQVAETPAAAAGSASVVISSLTGPDAARAVYLSPDGAVVAAAGQVFIDMSTDGPDVIAELEPVLAARGSRLLAVPIMGAPPVVAAGKATLLAGGDALAFDRAEPVLEELGTVRRVGSIGDAQRLKLLANSLLAIAAIGAAELQAAGEAAGLEPGDVFWVLSRLVPGLEARRDGYTGRAAQPTLFALRDLRKDLHLAAESFQRKLDVPSLAAKTRQLVDLAASRTPDEDIAALVRLYRPPAKRPT